MSHSLLSSLHADTLPVAEIGYAANYLSQAIELGIPVAPTAILPISTLKDIADYNQLGEKMDHYREQLNYTDPTHNQVARESLAQDIRRQDIPPAVSAYLAQIYHGQLQGDFVKVSASFASQEQAHPVTHHNVKGDANLGESFLAVWAEAVTAASGSRLELFPAAIILQAAPQPIVSGMMQTTHPQTGNKTRIYIESTWGVYSPATEADVFEVDNRTNSVVHSQLSHQKTYWARTLDQLAVQPLPLTKRNMASLTPSQLTQLARWAMKLKQQAFHQLEIGWHLVHQQLQITSIEPITLNQAETDDTHEILVVGDCLIGGYIQGICSVSPHQATDFITGQVLVTDTLTKSHQGLIRQAAAIITEQPITDSLLLQLINHYHIPTLVHARHATQRLKTLQEVMVDASGGKVLREAVAHHLPRTTIKLTTSINNPYTQLNQEADAYYFKSDFSFLLEQLNPTEVVSTSQAQLIKKALLTQLIAMSSKPTWYRFSAIHQGQLAPQNQDLFQHEPNPYFGTRGALFHLHEPAVLYFELGVIKDYLRQTNQKLRLVLPFVRSPGERELLLHMITSRLGEAMSQVSFWLELVSPDSVINLSQYLSHRIEGVIVPLDTLHASWFGLDPENPALLKQYPLNKTFVEQLLTYVQTATSSFMIELRQPHSGLLESLVTQGVSHLITKPQHLETIKKQLVVLEERQINHGRH